jgi:flagellar motor switch protein FliM
MEKVLNQEEIDAMVRLARSGGQIETRPPSAPPVELWDARLAGQIGREQLHAITSLHESFARNLTHSLGAYLRVVFAATLVSAEHLSYREFLGRIPETTYLASCRLDPMGVNAALQLDLKVAFPIIDLLLGGDALEVVFEQRLETGAAQRLMPPEEKTLSLSFEVTMPEVRGGLNVAVPALVSNALLRQISANWSRRPPRGATDSRQRLMRRLLECPFQAELGATGVRAAVSELAGLAPGDLLSFTRSAAEPASLLIAGQEMFRALPARCGDTRAARVLAAVAAANSPADPSEKTK